MYSIEQCKKDMIEIWAEFAETGEGYKPIKFKHLAHRCPCCEYSFNLNGWSRCESCPVAEWRSDRYNRPICDTEGVYLKWRLSETKLERQYWANSILIKAYMIRSSDADI